MKNKFLQVYLEKRCERTLFDQTNTVNPEVDLSVVIPAYKETFDTLRQTLASFSQIKDLAGMALFILINYKDSDSELIKREAIDLQQQLKSYVQSSPLAGRTQIFLHELSGKNKGVGLARKLLMDCALLCFEQKGQKGIIVNLDADTLVQPNYLYELRSYFSQHPKIEAASIAFEHQLNQCKQEEQGPIANYELHLRYFINMQKWVGLPYAFQTVGSAMAVRSRSYAKEGGMSVKQAGEDFYFLHKFSKNLTLGEIHSTTVYPAGRPSDRVPFGTGKAVNDQIQAGNKTYLSYHPKSFIILKEWIDQLEPLFNSSLSTTGLVEVKDDILKAFLNTVDYEKIMQRDVLPSKAGLTRIKKFYQWFDAFKLMKYLHYSRDQGRMDQPILDCCESLSSLIAVPLGEDVVSCLSALRTLDTQEDYYAQWSAGLISSPANTSDS